MKTYIRYVIITLFISIFHTSNVYAHHPLAGQKMETFFHGLLSGFGHPILGFDHLFFIIGVGILCLLAKKIFLGPLAFIIGMISGLFTIISGYNLFLVEFIIAISLLLIGIFIISGKKVNFNFISLSLLIIGLFHGWAFGETIVGQENINSFVMGGYLLGLSIIVWAISVTSSIIYKNIYKVFDLNDIKVKISGGIITGVGAFLLLEGIETKIISYLI